MKNKQFVCRVDGVKYYTTDPAIKELIKRDTLINKLDKIFGSISLITLFIDLLLCGCCAANDGSLPLGAIIVLSIVAVVFVIAILLLIGVNLSTIHSLDYIDVFKQSDEFIKQQKQVLKQKEQMIENEKKKKAKELIAVYDTLDDSNLSKQEKINIIKDYMR